jgi:hypothetical protein
MIIIPVTDFGNLLLFSIHLRVFLIESLISLVEPAKSSSGKGAIFHEPAPGKSLIYASFSRRFRGHGAQSSQRVDTICGSVANRFPYGSRTISFPLSTMLAGDWKPECLSVCLYFYECKEISRRRLCSISPRGVIFTLVLPSPKVHSFHENAS